METSSEIQPSFFSRAFWREFYYRPCGAREVLRLALPIVVSAGTVALMNSADRVYLSWYDPTAMNAAFQSGCLLWALITFPTAIAAYVNAFVAQYYGARQNGRIGTIVWQGVFFGFVFGLLFLAATPLVGPTFRALGATYSDSVLEQEYWFYFCLGACASIGHEPLSAFFSGRGEMKTVMVMGISAVVLNMVLDPLLIFGIGGHFRMGLAGAALASALSLWFKFLVYAWLVWKRDRENEFCFRRGWSLNWSEMKRLLRYGSMSGVQGTIENSFFTAFILIMGYFGETESAATAIAFNLNFLMLIPIFGMGIATTTMVGNQVGAQNMKLASRAAYTTVTLACAFASLFVIAFLTVPDFFLDIYMGRTPEKFVEIRPLARNLLQIVAVYLLADTVNAIFAAALRGAADTRFIMIATLSVSIPILAITFIGVRFFGMRVYWCWGWQTSYLFISGAVFCARFMLGKWKGKSLTR